MNEAPLEVLVSIRDALATAQNSSVNPAFVCGQLYAILNAKIKEVEKEKSKNEKAV